MVTVITTITTSDHHRIRMYTTIVTNRVTDSISIVPPHHSITFLHPHYLISRMIIAVTSPWTLVMLSHSKGVHYHLVLIDIAMILSQPLAIVSIVVRQVIS